MSSDSAWTILLRFTINLIFLIILIGFIYFRYANKEKFLFSFFLIGIIVFFVASIMKRIDIGPDLAFGLFAIGEKALIENGNWYLIFKEKEPEIKGI